MGDFGLFDDDFDRYTIGFTENQYQAHAEILSPPPSDANRAFSSPALDYAERHNRGEEKSFLDHSFNLERQRSKSVSKIHNNILGLVFELTERRKAVTPLLSRSMNSADFARPKSSDSETTSSPLPIIEVQQLPPILQVNKSVPNITKDEDIFSGFPDVNAPTEVTNKKPAKTKKTKKTATQSNAVTSKRFDQPSLVSNPRSPYKEPRIYGIVEEDVKTDRHQKAEKQEQNAHLPTDETNTDHGIKLDVKSAENNSVRFSTTENEESSRSAGLENPPATDPYADDNKLLETWKNMTQKLINAHENVRERRPSLFSYRSGFPGPNGVKVKMSFCQSSYKERAEKERITNIRRRHASQTNTGPLDYNKLNRQITKGARSGTLFW